MYADVSTRVRSPNLDAGFSTSDLSLISIQTYQDWKDTRTQAFLQIFANNFPLLGLVPTAYFPVCFYSKAVRLSLRFINAEKDSPLCGWVFFLFKSRINPKEASLRSASPCPGGFGKVPKERAGTWRRVVSVL